MIRAEPHPHYEKAPPELRWRSGSLPDLWAKLNEEAKTQKDGKYAGRVMPGGAHVGLRILESGQREVLIYRREPFTTDDGQSRFAAEVLTFCRHFGIVGWPKDMDFSDQGYPRCRLTEQARQDSLFGGGAS